MKVSNREGSEDFEAEFSSYCNQVTVLHLIGSREVLRVRARVKVKALDSGLQVTNCNDCPRTLLNHVVACWHAGLVEF
jgi:hypothetical protein